MKKLPLLTIYLILFINLSAQQIWHTNHPEWGTTQLLHGKVNVDPEDYKIASYIFVEEAAGWWTKPSFANPTIPIQPDSTFVLNYISHYNDRFCTRIITFLVPINHNLPLMGGLAEIPDSLLNNYDYEILARPHGDRLMEWSGIKWTVKRSFSNLPIGPGPNRFSSADTMVYVDENDRLYLSIKQNAGGQWLCSEIISDTTFGYGVYTFNLASRVDNHDINTVWGLFTWDDIARYSKTDPNNFYREIDIEFSYWNEPSSNVAQYVIHPWYTPGNRHRFPMGADENTIHQWEWRKDTIIFRSLKEDSTLIHEWNYPGSDFHYPDKENVRINLWLYNATSPSENQEVILSGFHFENLLQAPANLNATNNQPTKVILTWEQIPDLYYGIYRGLTDDPLKSTLLNEEWITGNSYTDLSVDPETIYYYWIRSSDNIFGSNSLGYSSGFSDYDTGSAIEYDPDLPDHLALHDVTLNEAQDTCFAAAQTIAIAGEGTTFFVGSGCNVKVVAGMNILVNTHTLLEYGAQVHLYIDNDGSYCNLNRSMVAAKTSEVTTFDLPEVIIEENKSFFVLYPNPGSGIFTLELLTSVEPFELFVEIYTIMGERILLKELEGSKYHHFDLSEMARGIYLVRVIRGNEMAVEKVVKQ